MDTTLVTVTVLSMGMAAALSVIVWRLLRDERQRSDARVAALQQLANPPVSAVGSRVSDVVSRVSDAGPRFADLEFRAPDPAPRASLLATPMFVEEKRESPWGTRFAVMTGLALVIASIVFLALASGNRKAIAAARTAEPLAATEGSAKPELELLSLRDSRTPGTLTITGMVQNPKIGASLSHVSVTAYTFDDKGNFLASGRALLDVTALTPGDDSPFVVTVPVTDAVARYRIGFRAEDGRVIAHVDKRQQGPIAP